MTSGYLDLDRIQFTLLTNNDRDFLEEMMYLAIFVPAGHPPLSHSVLKIPEISRYYLNWGIKNDLLIAAELDGKRIGAIWGRTFKPPDIGYGFISTDIPEISMAVLPEYRGKGIGTRLIQEISKHYAGLGVKAVSLSVDKRNKAVTLYIRTGFQIVSENENDYIMIKDIETD